MTLKNRKIMKQLLYKRARNGKVQQWEIEVEKDRFRTTEGYVDGKLTTTEWTTCLAKNVGRSNEVTPEQQSIKEAESKVKKKKDSGYVEDVNEIDNVTIIEPMLAHKWDSYGKKIQGPIASQPKLDGIRCIATKKGLFTRKGKPIVAAPHIESAVKQLLEGLDDSITLDGELYNHDLKDDFNEIISIVRKVKVKDEDIEKAREKLQYHVYDINSPNQSFAARYSAISNLIKSYKFNFIKLVPTAFFPKPDQDQIDQLYQLYLSEGYEGQMIRQSESTYQAGRSKNLLKRKEFIDEEFEIIDIEEGVGNRSGMMGRIKFGHFDSNARGSHDYFRELLQNKDQYIGKMATVRYQNLTPDGIPRFPVMIAIRDYE